MKLGLALAGGGTKGVAHIGVLKALSEENIKIEYISGTSSGSIIAALYAAGFEPDQIYNLFKKYAKDIKCVDIKNIVKLILGFILRGNISIKGLNSGYEIEKLINKFCKKKNIININNIKMPLLIPSVNLNNGELYIFSSNNYNDFTQNDIVYVNNIEIGKAVRASCSYPGIFEPCPYSNMEFIDGGIKENVPWRELKRIGANKVISVIFKGKEEKNCSKNIASVIECSIDYMKEELFSYEMSGTDSIIEIYTGKINILDTTRMEELYELGYKETKRQIKNILTTIST